MRVSVVTWTDGPVASLPVTADGASMVSRAEWRGVLCGRLPSSDEVRLAFAVNHVRDMALVFHSLSTLRAASVPVSVQGIYRSAPNAPGTNNRSETSSLIVSRVSSLTRR